MSLKYGEFLFPSSSGLGDIFARSYELSNISETKGVFQIVHSITEHSERYKEFAVFLCSRGYAVFVHDHIGNGRSVLADETKGYFGEQGGASTLIADTYELTRLISAKYAGLPIFMYGQGFGSFIAREYCVAHKYDLKGAVFCGTGSASPTVSVGRAVAKILTEKNGSDYRSDFLNNMLLGANNKRCKPSKSNFDWLTSSEEDLEKFLKDPLCCTEGLTVSAYADILSIVQRVNTKDWFKNIPKDLNLLLISGTEDPIGNYGKGVKEVFDRLQAAGHKNTLLKLYEGCRNELIHECGKYSIFDDIADWADSVIENKA